MAESAPRIRITKYENRRLYDTSRSRYVNLEELAAMIRSGADVEVVDARTGEDLTRSVLTQIILEDSRGSGHGTGALPIDVLRQMVRAEGTLVTELFRWYAEAARRAVPLPFGGFGFQTPMAAQAPSDSESLKREVTELRARLEALETRPARKKAAKRKAVSRRRAR